MTIATDLLQRHIETLVDDNAQWQTLIADDLLWKLPYAHAFADRMRQSPKAKRSDQGYGAYLSPGYVLFLRALDTPILGLDS